MKVYLCSLVKKRSRVRFSSRAPVFEPEKRVTLPNSLGSLPNRITPKLTLG